MIHAGTPVANAPVAHRRKPWVGMAPESHQNYQVGEMVLSFVARNELAVGISGAGLSGPAYRAGGLRGAPPALRVLEWATVLMRSVMAKIEAGRVEGVWLVALFCYMKNMHS